MEMKRGALLGTVGVMVLLALLWVLFPRPQYTHSTQEASGRSDLPPASTPAPTLAWSERKWEDKFCEGIYLDYVVNAAFAGADPAGKMCLKRVVDRANVTDGVLLIKSIGGTATATPYRKNYAKMFALGMKELGLAVEFVNIAHTTDSLSFSAHCLQVDGDEDIFLIEAIPHTTNDDVGVVAEYEALMRQLLVLPGRPCVVWVSFMDSDLTSLDGELNALAEHYGRTAVTSFRSALSNEIRQSRAYKEDLFKDKSSVPTGLSHVYAGCFLNALVRSVLEDATIVGETAGELQLPPPLLSLSEDTTHCVFLASLEPSALSGDWYKSTASGDASLDVWESSKYNSVVEFTTPAYKRLWVTFVSSSSTDAGAVQIDINGQQALLVDAFCPMCDRPTVQTAPIPTPASPSGSTLGFKLLKDSRSGGQRFQVVAVLFE